MKDALKSAIVGARDPADHQIPIPVTTTPPTSPRKRGRPRKDIDQHVLQSFYTTTRTTTLAKALELSPKTVRRRALEAELAPPGRPVFTHLPRGGGKIRGPSQKRPSHTTDEQIDQAVAETGALIGPMGRKLARGITAKQSWLVTRKRLEASLQRVFGESSPKISATIVRRVYKVAGPNSLTHHDGYHSEPSPPS
jgi:hypothetical protein